MLSIENLTRTEKLRMMEVIWDDLSHGSEALSSSERHYAPSYRYASRASTWS